MAADEKWYFTKEQLQNTPSRRCGFDADKELSYRQQAANFIQDMGQKLQVSQLCINTAIVYMHRFYMFHSFTHFPWNTIAAASFFLAAKVEEQPRKLEHVIRIANHCLHRDQPTAFDAKSEQYAAQSQDLVFNENVLLQTLGFDVAIDHPHTHVVRCCHLVKASKDLAQTSYFMASNSLHLTTMCLQYKSTVVACFCIHLACKWSNWQIPKSNEGKDWFYYVDKTVTSDLLEQLTAEFLKIFDKCPSRLKRKITSITTLNQNSANNIDALHAASSSSSPFDPDSQKFRSCLGDSKDGAGGPTFHSRSHHESKPGEDPHKKPVRPHDPAAAARDREYREKKERDRFEREKAAKAAAAAGLASAGSKHMPNHRSQPPSSSSSVATAASATLDAAKMKLLHNPGMANGRERYHAQQHSNHAAEKLDSNRQKPIPPDGKMVKPHDPNRHRDRHREQPKPAPAASASASASAANSVSASDMLPKPQKPANVAPVSSSSQDKNSLFSKQINSTSQRHKSPFSDANKSVPAKANGSGELPTLCDDSSPGLLSPPPPHPKKTSSLFSPEKTPPRENKKSWASTKTPTKRAVTETPVLPAIAGVVAPPLSPFGSPLPPPREKSTPVNAASNTSTPSSLRRLRTSSSGSEPELRPVVKKLDQTPGFENIIRDSKMGIKLPKVPDIIQPICDRAAATTETSISKELKPPDIIKPFSTSLLETPLPASAAAPAPVVPQSQPLVNGIETDPAAISTLLKEAAPTLNHLAPEPSEPPTVIDSTTVEKHKSSDHHHKSEKKKKKDKHKHKDKDKPRDEKKKKHKDKDKERHKSKTEKTETPPEVEVPLKITISKDKVQPMLDTASVGSGLKVKISKDRLKSDVIEPPPSAPAPAALKIKISKDQVMQYNSVLDSGSSSSGRKRERDKTSNMPPAKQPKTSYNSRQNGRSSYNKVAQLGDGEAVQVRLAESKYHSKGASKTS